MKVLAAILGGGLAARFFSELRDKQGLAYTTGLLYPTRVDRAYVLAQLGTAPGERERAEAALREQLERIQREPASEEEIRVAKAYILGNLAMDRRTNARQAWYLAAYEAAGVGHEFLDRYARTSGRSPPPTCSGWPGSTSPPSAPSSSARPSPSRASAPSQKSA